MSYIELKDGMKVYGEGENAVYAMNGMSLQIEKGELCVIMGASGSGKTTLLNVLGGLDSLKSGELVVDKKKVSGMSPKELSAYRRECVSFVFQFYNLIPDLTVMENIRIVSDISKNTLDINEVMKAVDITELKNRFPNELSGGQQQRAAIARAIVKNPSILLCDELTGALDSKTSKEVLKFVQKVNAEFGSTVVIITHNQEIRKMADRIIEVKDGKIIRNYMNENKMNVEDIEI
ncbi:MAG: ABC transporter ATP-binding protein [Ruminococcus sp.]|nr:ABC transporter ATP-binding protein [Ruminococcus sp.]